MIFIFIYIIYNMLLYIWGVFQNYIQESKNTVKYYTVVIQLLSHV